MSDILPELLLLLVYFETGSHCVALADLNLLCRVVGLRLKGDLPAIASQVLALRMCVTTAGWLAGLFFFLSLDFIFWCVCVCVPHVWRSLWKPEEGVCSLRTGVIEGESQHVGARNQTQLSGRIARALNQ